MRAPLPSAARDALSLLCSTSSSSTVWRLAGAIALTFAVACSGTVSPAKDRDGGNGKNEAGVPDDGGTKPPVFTCNTDDDCPPGDRCFNGICQTCCK